MNIDFISFESLYSKNIRWLSSCLKAKNFEVKRLFMDSFSNHQEGKISLLCLDMVEYNPIIECLEKFYEETDKFKIDRTKKRFIITWNPKGFLKKVK